MSLQINAFKCHVSAKTPKAMPSARTWLRTIGNIKVTAQTYNDIMVFTVKATQYVSGSAATTNLAEFDIIVRHNVAKKNLYERTKKAKLGSKVSIVGELDVYESKLCIELHNLEFISSTTPYTNSSNTSINPSSYTSASSSASGKKIPPLQLNKRNYKRKQPT